MNNIIFEAYVEVGPHNNVHVYRSRGVYEKSSRGNALNTSKERVMPTENDKSLINYVVAVLRNKKLFNKIATKDDTTTMDIQFNGGSALVNFDDGGSITIPVPRRIAASVITEAISVDDPNARTRTADPHLGVEFGPPDPDNGDMYGIKSVWTFSTMLKDKKRILNYNELEPKYRKAIQQVRTYLKAKGILPKITSKTNWNSVDVCFTGNGEAIINTDDGSIKNQRINYIKAASIVTEEKTNYFPY